MADGSRPVVAAIPVMELPDALDVSMRSGGTGDGTTRPSAVEPSYPYEDIPPPPAPTRVMMAREYTTELDDIRARLAETRKKDEAYEDVWTAIRRLDDKVDVGWRAAGDRERILEKRLHEAEELLRKTGGVVPSEGHNDGDGHDDADSDTTSAVGAAAVQVGRTTGYYDAVPPRDEQLFWGLRRRDRSLDLEGKFASEAKKARRYEKELWLGEAVDTKMAYRMQEIELDNKRLRRRIEQLEAEVAEREGVRPTHDYIRRATHLFNAHHEAMASMVVEADRMLSAAIVYNHRAHRQSSAGEEKEDAGEGGEGDPPRPVYCGRCNMLVTEEERGAGTPLLVRSREQAPEADGFGVGIGRLMTDARAIGYPERPRGVGGRGSGAAFGVDPRLGLTPASHMRAEAAHSHRPPQTQWSDTAARFGGAGQLPASPTRFRVQPEEMPAPQGLVHTNPNKLVFSQDRRWPPQGR